MEIVIKIPEEEYEFCKKQWDTECLDTLMIAVKYGTPLPEHGDLIDRNELLHWSYQIDSMYCMYDEVVKVDDIKNAPTIIEADEGSDAE